MSTTTDVAIIGAGIHGASAAYHLARSGVGVTVVERLRPAGGPTGLSSGVCRAYYTNGFLAEAARDSLRMMAGFEEIAPGHDAGFRRTGLLFLHPPADIEEVVANAARLNELGIRIELHDADALPQAFPQFNFEGIGIGAYEVDAGYADPAGTTAGMMAGALAAGAALRARTTVTEVRPRPGSGALISLDDGTSLEAQRLLIAAGPWTAPLARQLGVELPLTVERHVVATARIEDPSRVPFGHGDLVTGYYCRPEGADQYVMGWTHPDAAADPDAFERAIHRDEELALVQAVARRYPLMDEAQPRGGWASLYDVSPDWQPVIGEIARGVYVDAGTSGHGFKLAPALGRHVADLVLGNPDPRMEQFHPRRFAAGELLAAGYRDSRILG
ncbi:MAG TPA: FAD-binding oxidoreductase [Candidatus Limnocylindria bacterium]